jgi:hypothetical protein
MSRTKRLAKLALVKRGAPVAELAERLANFGKAHKLSLLGLKIKDLINDRRR